MALTPILAETVEIGPITEEQEAAVQTSRTYKVNWNTGRIVGYTDGRAALEQAIYKILQTERFAWRIYSWNYGFEMSKLMGQSEPVVTAEAERLISEALTADDRIERIADFSIEFHRKRAAVVKFTAVSVFGDIEITTEVTF